MKKIKIEKERKLALLILPNYQFSNLKYFCNFQNVNKCKKLQNTNIYSIKLFSLFLSQSLKNTHTFSEFSSPWQNLLIDCKINFESL